MPDHRRSREPREPNPDRWSLTVEAEIEPDLPPSFYPWYEHETHCPSPSVLARWRRLFRLGEFRARASDLWRFRFEEGPSATSKDVAAARCLMMTIDGALQSAFKGSETQRWVAFHYAARTSPALTISARCDGRPAPPRSLSGVGRHEAAKVLCRDLKIRRARDKRLAAKAIDIVVALREALDADADNTPESIEARLGLVDIPREALEKLLPQLFRSDNPRSLNN